MSRVQKIRALPTAMTDGERSSEYARSLIEASLDPLVTISPEGKITDVNEATVKVTGVPRETLIGTDFSDYSTAPEKVRSGYREVFDKGFVTDYPLTIRHRDGNLTDVLYNASLYRDSHNNVLGVFAAVGAEASGRPSRSRPRGHDTRDGRIPPGRRCPEPGDGDGAARW